MTGPAGSTGGASGHGWAGHVGFGRPERPVAFKLGEVLVDASARSDVQELLAGDGHWTLPEEQLAGHVTVQISGETREQLPYNSNLAEAVRRETLDLVETLLVRGISAQPNHVFFADQGDLTANPFTANPFTANPFTANPFTANPFTANPFTANPFTANPFTANPWPPTKARRTGIRPSSARPAGAAGASPTQSPADGWPRILVLDTGLPQDGTHSAPNDGPWVDSLIHLAAAHGSRSGGLTGIAAVLGENDSPDTDGNHRVDPVAGHGMFIASILARLAPTASVTVLRVIQHLGQATEDAVAEALGSAVGQFDLVNLSFSTYTPYEADVLARAIRAVQRGAAVTEPAGDRPAVVVASAGNDGIWAPSLPASLPDVISVAALDEHERGPAWFTNYGPWVSACAPGTDIEGAFWQFVDGERAWQGRATWSGTSFAAPYVVGALARAMHFHKQHNNGEQISAMEAVARVIDDPDRPWMPWLGTVVRGF